MSATIHNIEQQKTCTVCGFEKPISNFNKDRTHIDSLKSLCRDCCKSRNKTKRAASFESPEARKEYLEKKRKYNRTIGYYDNYFRKRFGISYDDVKSMYDSQLGRCANRTCGKELAFYHDNEHGRAHSNRACVDHDHNTGKVRALLCMPCNTILGTLETKEHLISGLMEYRAFFRSKLT